jgi:hypothetical protein
VFPGGACRLLVEHTVAVCLFVAPSDTLTASTVVKNETVFQTNFRFNDSAIHPSRSSSLGLTATPGMLNGVHGCFQTKASTRVLADMPIGEEEDEKG